MCGVMVGNEALLSGGTPRKGYPIAFHLAGNPPIGMMGGHIPMSARISREDDRSCLGVSGLLQAVAREKGNQGSDYQAIQENGDIFPGYSVER